MTLIIQSQSSLDAGWFRSLCSMFSHPSAYVREQLHHKLSEDLNSLKNEYAFFVYFFLFILSPSSQLWYNAADFFLLRKNITQMKWNRNTKIVYKLEMPGKFFSDDKVQAALDTSDYEYSCAPNDGRSCWRESNVQLFPGELQMRRPALRSSAQLRQ